MIGDRLRLVNLPAKRCDEGVELIREFKGELLMKGSLHTDELMRESFAVMPGQQPAMSDAVVRHPLADWDLRLFSKEIIKMGRQARAVVDRLRCKSPVESNAYA